MPGTYPEHGAQLEPPYPVYPSYPPPQFPPQDGSYNRSAHIRQLGLSANATEALIRNQDFTSFRDIPFAATEKELREVALRDLERLFRVETEVSGTHCSGSRLRIDAVLRPRDHRAWFDQEKTMFGVEFKRSAGQYESIGKFCSWLAQAADYTHVNWDGYGYLQVLTCPAFTGEFSYPVDSDMFRYFTFLAARLAGQLGVGELGQIPRQGWTLRMSGEDYWSENGGMSLTSRRTLLNKTGSGR